MNHLPEAKESERGGSKGDVRRGVTAKGAIEKSWGVGVIDRKEVRGDDPIERDPVF